MGGVVALGGPGTAPTGGPCGPPGPTIIPGCWAPGGGWGCCGRGTGGPGCCIEGSLSAAGVKVSVW